MIEFVSSEDWNPLWEQPEAGEILIDLRKAATKQDVIKKIGYSLRGQDSPLIRGNSLDAMTDVASDWFSETWGSDRTIYIAGGKNIQQQGELFLAEIVDCLNQAFIDTLYDRSLNHNGAGIAAEIGNIKIYLGLN